MKVDALSDAQLALRPHRVSGPVMAAFLDAAAIQPTAAIAYRPATPAAVAAVRRLRASGVLKRAGAGEWFDLRAHYAREQAAAARRAVFAVAAALTIAVVSVLFYRG